MTHLTTPGVFCLACLLATGSAAPRPPQDDTHMSCVERLEMPVYPPIARAARMQIGLTAAVLLGPDGSLQRIAYELHSERKDWEKLFSPPLDEALKASKFAAACGGRTVKVNFDFRLSNHDGLATRIAFGYPNRFEVSIGSPVIH